MIPARFLSRHVVNSSSLEENNEKRTETGRAERIQPRKEVKKMGGWNKLARSLTGATCSLFNRR